MTEARRFRTRNAKIAWNPAAEMSGVRSDHAILRQNIIDSLAQRARVDEPCTRLVGMRKMMIVTGPDSFAGSIIAAPGCSARCAKLGQKGFRCRLRIAKYGEMHRPLVAELRRFDINLSDSRFRRDQLAFLSGPLREAHAKPQDEVAFGNKLVRGRRGKTAADAKRPWIV